MNQFNLSNFLNKFINYSLSNQSGSQPKALQDGLHADAGFQLANEAMTKNLVQKNIAKQSYVMNALNFSMLNDLKMNNLASLERSSYIKGLMNLPKEIEEVLVILQNNTTKGEELTKLLTTNINLANLAELIQSKGKAAMNKLIFVMSEASKQGITDVSQIKDAIKFINASVSVASQENQTQVLKSFMLLYLPWLPLQEGVDFELEIESYENENGDSETSLTILISTKNYGNVRIILILNGMNSFDIFINCIETFPKEELLQRINEETKNHALQSTVTFEQKEIKKAVEHPHQAKVSMSNLSEINPFLLLMANALIRHTIDLDNQVGEV